MRQWTSARIAHAAGADLLAQGTAGPGPEFVTIDSRSAGPGALFVGLPGANVDGGAFAAQALQAGAWGVVTSVPYADALTSMHTAATGVVLAATDPLKCLQRLATAWRR